MNDATTPREGRFELGDFRLQSGKVLPRAQLAYATWGSLNEQRDNVIVFPTWYTARHHATAPCIGAGKALDPTRYFIVVPDMFTNGVSTSPSNAVPPCAGMDFPLVTAYDNVQAQHRLLVEHFGVTGVQLVLGFSMSGQQAYHWGALFPDFVERICCICGSARTAAHNLVYLNTYKRIMECADGWDDGTCRIWPPRLLTAVASLAATMALSQDWYRAREYEQTGAVDLNGFLAGVEGLFRDCVPVDLYHQTLTWMAADVSDNAEFRGDLPAALAAITARALIMPCDTDMYFRVADNELEVAHMPAAELRVIHSTRGHLAGLPGFSTADDAFVDEALEALLHR